MGIQLFSDDNTASPNPDPKKFTILKLTEFPGDKYFYVFVRQDITLAQQIVQSNHATFEAARHSQLDHSEIPYRIVIGVPDKAALRRAVEKLKGLGIGHHEYHEPDYDLGLTAVATAPETCPNCGGRGVVDIHVLKAGSAVKMNAGGLLHNSEALACPQCGGVGGHHYEGYGSVPRCSTLGPMQEKA